MSRDAIKVDIMSASDNRSEAKDGAAASHCLRTGADYLRSLRDGRQVFVEGELQHRKYQKTIGQEKVEWPVTEIVFRAP